MERKMTNSPNYHAYLLRVWRENDREPWRATLENPHTGERLAFAGADRLLAYLSQQWPSADPGAACLAPPIEPELSKPT